MLVRLMHHESPSIATAIGANGAALTPSRPAATIPRDGIAPYGIAPFSAQHVSESPSRSGTALSTQVFHILLSLVDEDLHGYAIIQDVAARTDGEVRLTASTLYAAMKRLLESGWIEERTTRPTGATPDPRRRYYRLTKLGRDVARG